MKYILIGGGCDHSTNKVQAHGINISVIQKPKLITFVAYERLSAKLNVRG